MPDRAVVAGALLGLREAERQEEEARERVAAAQLRLAELMGVGRRDKDMGFDAEYAAREFLVAEGIAEWVLDHGHAWRATGTVDTGHDPTHRQWECVCGARAWGVGDDPPEPDPEQPHIGPLDER